MPDSESKEIDKKAEDIDEKTGQIEPKVEENEEEDVQKRVTRRVLRSSTVAKSKESKDKSHKKIGDKDSDDLHLLLEAASATGKKKSKKKKKSKARSTSNKPKPPVNPLATGGRWTPEEDELLRKAVRTIGPKNWKKIAAEFLNYNRTDVQCLHRWQKVLKPGLVKGPWTKEEDDTIVRCREQGITKWSEIAANVPGRIGKQCRERWFNHLDPDIRRDDWTEEEDKKLIEGQLLLGNKWSQIAKLYLPGRPENAVKNRWNAATRKRRVNHKRKHEGGSTHTIDIVTENTRPLTKIQARFLALRPKKDIAATAEAMEAMVSLGKDGEGKANDESSNDKGGPSKLDLPEDPSTKEKGVFTTPKSGKSVESAISPANPLKSTKTTVASTRLKSEDKKPEESERIAV